MRSAPRTLRAARRSGRSSPARPGHGPDRGHRRGHDRTRPAATALRGEHRQHRRGPIPGPRSAAVDRRRGLDRRQWIAERVGRLLGATDRGGPDLRRRQPQPLARQAGRDPPDRVARRQGPWPAGQAGLLLLRHRSVPTRAAGRSRQGHTGAGAAAQEASTRGSGWACRSAGPTSTRGTCSTSASMSRSTGRDVPDPRDRRPAQRLRGVGRDQQRNLGRRRAEDPADGLRETTVVAAGPAPARPAS